MKTLARWIIALFITLPLLVVYLFVAVIFTALTVILLAVNHLMGRLQ